MTECSPSRRLRATIQLAAGPFFTQSAAMMEHPDFARLYPRYLLLMHTVVRASVPLMQAARDRCLERDGDALTAAMGSYLEQHIPEELHHDEWLLDDLQTLGVDREQAQAALPSPNVAAMVGAQYYWLHHHHPLALLGYIAVMEGYPPNEEWIHRLVERTGYPPAAFETMLKHSRLDPYHRDDLDRLLDTLPLSSAHAALLGVSALHTIAGATQALMEITSSLPAPVGTVADTADTLNK